jgi:hypothetical protein
MFQIPLLEEDVNKCQGMQFFRQQILVRSLLTDYSATKENTKPKLNAALRSRNQHSKNLK